MINQVWAYGDDTCAMFGSVAYKFRFARRDVIARAVEAAKHCTNRHFVYSVDGNRLFAAQSTEQGALNYMADDRVLVSVVFTDEANDK
jgi:hypothetical protein